MTDTEDRPDGNEESSVICAGSEGTIVSDPTSELCGRKMEPSSPEWRGSAIMAGEGSPAGEVRESDADENPASGAEAKDHHMVIIKQKRSFLKSAARLSGRGRVRLQSDGMKGDT